MPCYTVRHEHTVIGKPATAHSISLHLALLLHVSYFSYSFLYVACGLKPSYFSWIRRFLQGPCISFHTVSHESNSRSRSPSWNIKRAQSLKLIFFLLMFLELIGIFGEWNVVAPCQTSTFGILAFWHHHGLLRILQIQWPDMISDVDLWQKTQKSPAESEIRRWRLIRYTLRKPACSVTRQALTWTSQGKRKRGHLGNTWRWELWAVIKKMGLTWSQIKARAQDSGDLYSWRGDGTE